MAALKFMTREFNIRNKGHLYPKDKISNQDHHKLQHGDIIYIYNGQLHIYVGQTKHFMIRNREHDEESNHRYINGSYIEVIVNFGKLVDQLSLDDIEKQLITYVTTDYANSKKMVDNDNMGNTSESYQNQDVVYTDIIEPFWEILYKKHYVQHQSLKAIRNSALFKYSPFSTLPSDKVRLINHMTNRVGNYLIKGLAGTGKTVVLTNLAASLHHEFPKAIIGVAVKPNWRDTGRKIFEAYGAKNIKVYSPNQIIANKYNFDYLIVDEAHRLRRYYSKSLPVLQKIFKNKDGSYNYHTNELIMLNKRTKYMTLLYDPSQAIRPNDIPRKDFDNFVTEHNFTTHYLSKEYRIQVPSGSDFSSIDYINGIISFLQIDQRNFNRNLFRDYLQNNERYHNAYFGVVNSIQELFDYLTSQENYHQGTQNRVIAGFTRPWKSHRNKKAYDWVEGSHHWRWNSQTDDWINQPDSRNEIGCIHSVQGVDLNYVGVIISKDISIDGNGHICAIRRNYKDRNGTYSKKDINKHTIQSFNNFIKHIYYVLLTRGINGVRVYFEDKKLRNYFYKYMGIDPNEAKDYRMSDYKDL